MGASVTSPAAEWVAKRVGASEPLNECQQRAANVLASIGRLYNLQFAGPPELSIEVIPEGLRVLFDGELATFDGDEMTRLVLAAHAECVRVAVRPWRPDEARNELLREAIALSAECDADDVEIHALEIILTARDREGVSLFDRHPSLDSLAASARAAQSSLA